MSGSTHAAELTVPARENAWAASIGYLFILTFVLLAAANLIYLQRVPFGAKMASCAWLLFVFLVVVTSIREEGGVRQYVINRIGVYASHQFVRAEAIEKEIWLSIGYMMLGKAFSYLKIPASSISSIRWSSGQGTAMAGRDLDDWSLAIWYHYFDGQRRKRLRGGRDAEVFILGPSGQKVKVEALGKQLVAFLTSVGLELTVGRDDCEFNSTSSLRT